MQTLVAKFGVYALLLFFGFIAGMVTTQRLQKPVVIPKDLCPDLIHTCQKQEPCNGIDFDKIKSRHVTIENTQYLTVNGDSVLLDKLDKLKCK